MMTLGRCAPIVVVAGLVTAATVFTAGPKFYDDDPIARMPERKSAANAKPLGIELFFEYSYNLFVNAKRKPSNTKAGSVPRAAASVKVPAPKAMSRISIAGTSTAASRRCGESVARAIQVDRRVRGRGDAW